MSTISNQVRSAIGHAQNAVQKATHDAAHTVKKGVKTTVGVVTDPSKQYPVEEGVRSAIDTLYSKISGLSNTIVNALEQKGTAALHAPVSAMKDLNIARLGVNATQSSNSRALRSLANKIIGYHEGVIKKSHSVSLAAAKKTHAIVRLTLSPVRLAAKLLQIESVGAIIQNTVALAVGFLVRGLVLTAMQIGHVLPYAASAAIAGGLGLGIAALALKVSPLAAAGAAVALVLVAQQAQIISLGKKVDLLTNAIRRLNQQTQKRNALELRNRLSTKIANHKGKIAAAIALSAVAALGYIYGGQAVALATPHAKAALDYSKSTTAYQVGAEYAAAVLAKAGQGLAAASELVAPYAVATRDGIASAASATRDAAQSVADKVVSLFRAAEPEVCPLRSTCDAEPWMSNIQTPAARVIG